MGKKFLTISCNVYSVKLHVSLILTLLKQHHSYDKYMLFLSLGAKFGFIFFKRISIGLITGCVKIFVFVHMRESLKPKDLKQEDKIA